MTRIATGLATAGLILLSSGASAQERWIWDTFLAVNDVRAMVHDGERLWLATGGGTVAYEPGSGRHRIYHRATDGLLSDSLSGVAVSPDGRVWIATERAGISVFMPSDESWEPFTSLRQPIPGDRIQRIRFSSDTLFVATADGFAVFGGGELKIVCLSGVDLCGLPSFDVKDLASDPNRNGVWLATAGGVAHRDSLGRWTTYAQGPPSPTAERIARHRGNWIAVFSDGAYRLEGQPPVWRSMGGPSEAGDARDLMVAGGRIYLAGKSGVWSREGEGGWTRVGDRGINALCLFVDPNGVLWAGARDAAEQGDGLWRLVDGSWRQTRFPGPSNRAHYRALAFDASRVLHMSHARSGTVPMIQSFDGRTWSPPRDVGDWTFDLLFAPNSDLWLAQCCCRASGCDLKRLSGGVVITETPRNLRDIVYDQDGNLWGASDQAADQEVWAQGLWFHSRAEGSWTQIKVETPGSQLLRNRVRAVLPIGRFVWIGYSERGVHRWDIGPDRLPLTGDDVGWTHYSTEAAQSTRRIISDAVTRLAAREDQIWVGTTGGLSIIEPTRMTNIGAGFFGLPSPVVNDLLVLRDGGGWVATGGSGVTRVIPAQTGYTFVTFRPPDLPHPNVESLALDPDGRTLWCGTSRGLARATPVAETGAGGAELIAYPNPYVPGCGDGIRLLGFSGSAEGVVVDLSGRLVRRIQIERAGDLAWDGRDATGVAVAPGLYRVRLGTANGRMTVGIGIGDGPCPR